MRSSIGVLLLCFFSSAWSHGLSHFPAPQPPVSLEPHAKPSAKAISGKHGVVASSLAKPVEIVVVGCNLTEDQVNPQIQGALEAFGAAGVRLSIKSVLGIDSGFCGSALLDSDTLTALDNVTSVFNNLQPLVQWRADAGADLIVLLRPHAPKADRCGAGWQNNGLDAAYGFAVVETGTCPGENYSMAHELGHLFGAAHGPKTDSVKGIYAFSKGFDGVTRDGQWMHTLMSYGFSGSPLYPRFSARKWTKTSGRYNNAKTIRLTAPVIANFR